MENADREAADLNLDRANTIAEDVGQPTLRWLVGYQRAAMAIHDGDLARAEQLAGEVAEVGTSSGQPDAFMIYGGAILLAGPAGSGSSKWPFRSASTA